jgi:hypothetical protein
VELILHVPVVIDETGHLFLQPVILLHQQLIHCTQLPIHSLQARGLLALLLPASAVLEPDLDLLGLDVAEDGAVPDELLPAQRAGLGALAVDALQRLHLLRRVPHVLARVHLRRGAWGEPLPARHRRHRHRVSKLARGRRGAGAASSRGCCHGGRWACALGVGGGCGE